MNLVSKRLSLLPLIAFALLIFAPVGHSAYYLDGQPDALFTGAALPYQGRTLWVQGLWMGNDVNYGRTFFGGSAIYLDPWNVLLTAHQVGGSSPFPTLWTVGSGNFATNPPVVASVRDLAIYPGWDSNSGGPDLVIAHLETPLPIPNGSGFPLNRTSTFIASAGYDEQIWNTGYGIWGNNSGPSHPQDGNMRAWTGLYRPSSNASQWSWPYFYIYEWDYVGSYGPLSGSGKNGDSGGGCYNSTGALVGMSTAAQSGVGFATSATWAENLANTDIQNWIYNNLIPGLFMNSETNGSVRLAWCTNAPGFNLEMNTDLAPANWVSVTNSPVVVNDLYQVEILPAQGSCFFRLHSKRTPLASPMAPASIAPTMNLGPTNSSKTNRATLL